MACLIHQQDMNTLDFHDGYGIVWLVKLNFNLSNQALLGPLFKGAFVLSTDLSPLPYNMAIARFHLLS